MIYMGAYMSENTLWEWHDNLQASLAWKKIQHPPKFLGWSLNGKVQKSPKSWSKKNQRNTLSLRGALHILLALKNISTN